MTKARIVLTLMETLLFRAAKADRRGKAHLLRLLSEIAADYNPLAQRLSQIELLLPKADDRKKRPQAGVPALQDAGYIGERERTRF